MDQATVFAFLGVAVVVIMTPGPDTVMTVQNTLFGGRRAGLATALGVAVGQGLWTLAASVGIAAILVASEPLFHAVRLIGSAYLIALGLHSLHAAWHSRDARSAVAGGVQARRGMPARKGLVRGLVSNLSNPKMAVFFLALLPQFVPVGSAALGWSVLLGLMFCTLTFIWLVGYALAAARFGTLLRSPKVRRILDTVMGTVLVGFGIRLAVDAGAS